MAGADSICLYFIQSFLRHNLLAAFPYFSSSCFYIPREVTRKVIRRRQPGLVAKPLDKELWALSQHSHEPDARPGHLLSVLCLLISLSFPHTGTSGSFILLENSSRHRLRLMRLGTRQGSTIAGLDVGFRYACNINDSDLKPICAKVIFWNLLFHCTM